MGDSERRLRGVTRTDDSDSAAAPSVASLCESAGDNRARATACLCGGARLLARWGACARTRVRVRACHCLPVWWCALACLRGTSNR